MASNKLPPALITGNAGTATQNVDPCCKVVWPSGQEKQNGDEVLTAYVPIPHFAQLVSFLDPVLEFALPAAHDKQKEGEEAPREEDHLPASQ